LIGGLTLKSDTLSHKDPPKGKLGEEVGSKLDALVTPSLREGCAEKANEHSKCASPAQPSHKIQSLPRAARQCSSKCDILRR